jgi:hypothetical protein
MNPRRVVFTSGFDAAFRNLGRELQRQVREAIHHFRERTRENALRPERKAGLSGVWAFRVTSAVRVFYIQERDEHGAYSLLFHVGQHDDYRTIARHRPRR